MLHDCGDLPETETAVGGEVGQRPYPDPDGDGREVAAVESLGDVQLLEPPVAARPAELDDGARIHEPESTGAHRKTHTARPTPQRPAPAK